MEGASIYGLKRNDNPNSFLFIEGYHNKICLISGDIVDHQLLFNIITEQQIEIIFPNHPANPGTVEYFEKTKIEGFFGQKFHDDVRFAINSLRQRGDLAGVSSGNFPDLINQFVEKEKLVKKSK